LYLSIDFRPRYLPEMGMDHLPKTLLCLMNTVVEQYIEFSWASQEQNGKMKITT
jgi:hypothetical protein